MVVASAARKRELALICSLIDNWIRVLSIGNFSRNISSGASAPLIHRYDSTPRHVLIVTSSILYPFHLALDRRLIALLAHPLRKTDPRFSSSPTPPLQLLDIQSQLQSGGRHRGYSLWVRGYNVKRLWVHFAPIPWVQTQPVGTPPRLVVPTASCRIPPRIWEAGSEENSGQKRDGPRPRTLAVAVGCWPRLAKLLWGSRKKIRSRKRVIARVPYSFIRCAHTHVRILAPLRAACESPHSIRVFTLARCRRRSRCRRARPSSSAGEVRRSRSVARVLPRRALAPAGESFRARALRRVAIKVFSRRPS